MLAITVPDLTLIGSSVKLQQRTNVPPEEVILFRVDAMSRPLILLISPFYNTQITSEVGV